MAPFISFANDFFFFFFESLVSRGNVVCCVLLGIVLKLSLLLTTADWFLCSTPDRSSSEAEVGWHWGRRGGAPQKLIDPNLPAPARAIRCYQFSLPGWRRLWIDIRSASLSLSLRLRFSARVLFFVRRMLKQVRQADVSKTWLPCFDNEFRRHLYRWRSSRDRTWKTVSQSSLVVSLKRERNQFFHSYLNGRD